MTVIHLIGAEGFIGRSLQLEAQGLDLHCWSHQHLDSGHYFNLLDQKSWKALLTKRPTHVILLSWPGLPNYQEPFHVTRNLPACVELIEQLAGAGLKRLVVSGTCYEYGLQNGPLKEEQLTDPVNCYAIAKDTLRRTIERRYSVQDLQWCWVRIFYPYGHGQNPRSFLASLQRALDRGEPSFSMSSGRQVRDFVPVSQVARLLLRLATHHDAHGIYNCGSGQPISLRELAEERISKSAASTLLRVGVVPDRLDEPLAFWADTSKSDTLI